ncbi:nucleotidyltransferase [Oleiphilus messinensis]|uniref:Nucleotidyltransferase n=1 Tax=Oleiphilus messinensis TaxID=141451 RepID=A0A1Y0IGH9_9GAMM|nr:nucleotidyltransferase family protein [Oleiphilus messinensis]ARU58523.1 nucleotidyltransferase [Oleiphilus messinensis]
MKAMILAAGKGERMRPLTLTTPKPLLMVRSRPLIEHHILALKSAGIGHIVINVSWLGEKIEHHLGTGERFGVCLEYSHEATPLETAGGIQKTLPKLTTETPWFIVVNGDVWTDYDYRELVQLGHQLETSTTGTQASETESRPHEIKGHLVLVDNPTHHPEGDFALSAGQGPIKAIQNSGQQQYTFSGISLLNASLFGELKPGVAPLAPLLRNAIAKGQISGEYFNGEWSDIGTPERLAQVNSTHQV